MSLILFQSAKGMVVIDAFRPINPQFLLLGKEPNQTTSDQSYQSTANPGFGLPAEQTSLLYPDQLPQNVPRVPNGRWKTRLD